MRFLQIDCQKQMCVRSGPPARARIDNWLWMSPRYRLRGVTSAKLVLEERALGPSVSANKGRRFTPMTSRWSFRGSPELCESLIPILQGLTRFLSRFHVRQHGEKPAVFFACIEYFSTQANYFQKCACMSTLFFPDSQYTGLSPSENCTKLIKQKRNRCMSPSGPVYTSSAITSNLRAISLVHLLDLLASLSHHRAPRPAAALLGGRWQRHGNVAASLRQRLSSESLSCEFWQRHGNVAAMSWQQPGRQAEIVVRSTQNWPIPPHPCEGL